MVWFPSRPVLYATVLIILLPLPFYLCAPLHVSTTSAVPVRPALPESDTCPPTAACVSSCQTAIREASTTATRRPQQHLPHELPSVSSLFSWACTTWY